MYVVAGGTRASADPGAAYVPSAWSSPDGKTWTAEPVPHPSSAETAFDTSDAWLGAPGSGPNGDVAALGPNEASSHSAVFYRTAVGTWQYVTDTSVNEGNGTAGLAVPLADGRILATVGTTGGVRTGIAGGAGPSRLTAAGRTRASQRVFEAGRGDVLSPPVAVPGGFAAAGATSDDTHSQPVVWLSADGTAWSPVVVPSYQDGVTSQVALLGDDLVVT